MIQIGRFKFGIAPVSMIVVFIMLSSCAVIAAFDQARPEWSMPLVDLILINEGMALLGTLIYGIFIHFALVIIDKIRNR